MSSRYAFHTFLASIAGESVGVSTFVDLAALTAALERDSAPWIGQIARAEVSPAQRALVHTDCPEASIRFDRKTKQLSVCAPARLLGGGVNLLYYAHLLLEERLQRESTVTAHCAAVARDGVAAVLWGKTGAGKTVTAVQLCRNHGAALIGNDLAILRLDRSSGASVVGGSKFFLLRQASVVRSTPDLLSHFPDEPLTDPWLRKVAITPEAIGVRAEVAASPIRRIYVVHVDETQARAYSRDGDTLTFRLDLHENLSRYIRGSATPFLLGGPPFTYGGYIPPLDTRALYSKRAELMQTLCDVGVRYVSGPVSEIAKHIARDMGWPKPATV